MITPRKARFGLDLGRAGVKLVRCQADTVTGAERRVDASLKGAALQNALVVAVREVAAELGVKPDDELNIAVPRAKAIVKRMTLPQVTANELERMIRFQASKSLPFDLDEVALTWNAVGETDGLSGQSVMFAGVRQQVLDELRAVVEGAGFTTGCVEISSQAAARAMALSQPLVAGTETLLVEVGHTSSDVVVFEGQELLFSRSASVGCGDQPQEDPQWLKRLAQEVVRSVVAARTGDADESSEIDLSGSRERTGPPTALFLAGGAAAVPELHAALTEEVGIAPTVLSGLGPEPEDIARGARFVVARGLADPRRLAGVPELDFARRTEALAARSQRQRALAIGATAVLALIGLIAIAQFNLASRANQIELLNAERKTLAPTVAKARELLLELDTAEGWDARKGRELEIFQAVSRALPEDEQVYLSRMRWVEGRQLRLSGRAKNWDAVGAFLSNLDAEPLVRKASFDSIRKPSDSNALGVEFSGQAVLEQPE
jgi:type IV pilus assembly protein PilM